MANENKFTAEMIEKAKAAKSAAELLTLAKENGIDLSEAEAVDAFAKFNKSGEISDDELDNISGGGCGDEAGDTQKYANGTQVTYKTGSYKPTMTVIKAQLNPIANSWSYTLQCNDDGHMFYNRPEDCIKQI